MSEPFPVRLVFEALILKLVVSIRFNKQTKFSLIYPPWHRNFLCHDFKIVVDDSPDVHGTIF